MSAAQLNAAIAAVMAGRARPLVFFTIDVHDYDRAEDLDRFVSVAETYAARFTLFVPTNALGKLSRLRELQNHPLFELGNHSQLHNEAQRSALINGTELGFLRDARDAHADYFGAPPMSFRAPFWGGVGPRAREALQELGYRVDCSITPQRLGFLSSHPLENPYLFARRTVQAIGERLIGVPTTTLMIPFATQFFRGMPHPVTRAAMRLFLAEARLRQRVALSPMFHFDEFDNSRREKGKPLSWRTFAFRRHGGFGLRALFVQRDNARLFPLIAAVIETLARRGEPMTCAGFADEVFARVSS